MPYFVTDDNICHYDDKIGPNKMATAQELLTATELAILEVLQYGQVQKSNTLIQQRATYDQLCLQRDRLKQEIAGARGIQYRLTQAVPRRDEA